MTDFEKNLLNRGLQNSCANGANTLPQPRFCLQRMLIMTKIKRNKRHPLFAPERGEKDVKLEIFWAKRKSPFSIFTRKAESWN